jgi:starvation-inducible outer membrane lipoprotein
MRNSFRWIAPLLITLTACSSAPDGSEKRAGMSQRERDSILSESGLPGTKVVGRAMKASDSAAVRASALDSASQ